MTYALKNILQIAAAALFLVASQFPLSAQTRQDSVPAQNNATAVPGNVAPAADSQNQPERLTGGLPAESSEGLASHPLMIGVKVAMDERNDLFLNVDNPIGIKVSGAPAEEIIYRMRGEGAMIEKASDTLYKVRVSQPGSVILEVVRKTDTAEVVVGGRAMYAKPLPRPSAFFAGKNTGYLTKKELKEGKTLTAVFTKLPFTLSAPVESYLLTIVLPEKAGNPTWKINGADISEAARKGLKDAPVGSVLFFDEIMVRMPGENTPRMITGLVLRIGE
jgi:hypothetical protein